MAIVDAPEHGPTTERILAAARHCLGTAGFGAFSTRAVAEAAGVPLSQIHYHFGSKQRLLLEVIGAENEELVARQRVMFEGSGTFAEKWDRACDYLEEDLGSGFVRRFHELFAQAYGDPELAAALRGMVLAWQQAIADWARRDLAPPTLERLGFDAQAFAAIAASAFLGAESQILIGLREEVSPARAALRQFGRWIDGVDRESTANRPGMGD